MRRLVLPLVLLALGCKQSKDTPDPAPEPEPVKRDFVTEMNELVTQRLKDKGVTKAECPQAIADETAEFDCMVSAVAANGPKRVPVHASRTGKGSYDFTIGTNLLDPAKVANQVPESLGVRQADCGRGLIYVNVGETFECKAIHNTTSKPVRVIGKLQTKDEITYKILVL